MKETRMTTTSNYGFNQIDCAQDVEILFKDYIEKDSKENWQKADTIIKSIEDKVDKVKSDTDNVTDRSGRTQEQINRTFYKRMCKEIPSPSGEPITVENGEEGYVLSAEINGNTQLFKRAKDSQDEWIIIPNDEGRDTVLFEYKLDSTQAIISNNLESYPIYVNEEDKANKAVISLRGTSEIKDTLEIKEDCSGVWSHNLATQTIKYSDNWQTHDKHAEGYKTYRIQQKEQITNVNSICICDKLPHKQWITALYPTPALAGEYITVHGDAFIISVKEETAPTIDGFKNYLKKIGDIIITYPIKTPIITPIPKELTPIILTQQTNILEVGGKVKASSFKVTLPTTDRIKKEYILTPINGWTGTAKANLLQTGDTELVLDLTIPEQFNTLITNLPNELRPKVERTVLGYNGNTPVVIKVLPTGEVKCMTQQSGKIELNDTYEI